ncbi:MAG TPA: hypothetical protein VFU21_20120 [Kofleriaceae bacterium]|nr:hypothetical protein [Kofleriaceae bacterium]
MRLARAAAVLVAVAACGERSAPTRGDAPPAPHATSRSAAPAWSWRDPPTGDAGQTAPTFIAAGRGRLVVATAGGCLELLDGETGKPAAARRCEKGGGPLGLAVIGDVAIVAGEKSVRAFSLEDLREVWKRDTGGVQSEELARPGAVDGRFCYLVSDDRSGRGIECLDPATGRPGQPWTIGGFRVAFGERLVGLITSHRPKSLPYADGLELMVELYTVDRKPVIERAMAGRHGPRFVQTRPVFVAQTDGARGRTRWFVDRDGRELDPIAGEKAASATDTPAGDRVVDGEMSYVIAGERVQAYRAAAPR